MDMKKASGIYLLLRLAFDLPRRYPREQTQVFGGWLHLSTGKPGELFDLSWPVSVESGVNGARIDRFRGYRGKGYDALSEYQYFSARFGLRTVEVLTALKFAP
jgi:hypothetical protein